MEKLDELKKPPKAEPEAVGKFDKQFKELMDYKGGDEDGFDNMMEALSNSMTDEELEKYEKDFDAVFKHAKQFMVTK
jgi:hypothetical protein